MRYAIISDIHGNLEALQGVLKCLESENIDAFICSGDLVGYGANPNECIESVRDLNSFIVAGNHDYSAVGLTDFTYFNRWAKEAILWTQKEVTLENKIFLEGLKLKIEMPVLTRLENSGDTDNSAKKTGSVESKESSLAGFTLVHSSPYSPEKWIYILTLEDAFKCFPDFTSWICFIGHSHCPFVFELDERSKGKIILENEVQLHKNRRYVINAGSVGQPRDGDKRACFIIFDTEGNSIKMNRIPYNYELTQKKIINAGLPKFLAERLARGR